MLLRTLLSGEHVKAAGAIVELSATRSCAQGECRGEPGFERCVSGHKHVADWSVREFAEYYNSRLAICP